MEKRKRTRLKPKRRKVVIKVRREFDVPKLDSNKNEITSSSRLNKFIANAGICSRRQADELIQAGEISINGKVVQELGTKVNSGDIVKYKGSVITGTKKVYILLNKPKNCISTLNDEQDRLTVADLVSKATSDRVYPMGRLDRNTTGVLLLTNDGDLTKKLTHPSSKIAKIYHVQLETHFKQEDMDKISAGLILEDGEVKVDRIDFANDEIEQNEINLQIHSGRNRIVRRIFEHLGYRINKLDRLAFAGLTKKNVPRGKWRYLSEKEVGFLKMI